MQTSVRVIPFDPKPTYDDNDMANYQRKTLFFILLLTHFILKSSAVCFSKETGKSLKILQSSQNQLKFEISARNYQIENRKSAGKVFKSISIPNFAQTFEPDKPQLPVKAVLFALPPSGNVTLQVRLSDPISLGSLNIAATPRWGTKQKVFENGDVKTSPDLITKTLPSGKSFPTNSFYPPQAVALDTSIYLRGQRLGRIRFFPVRYNPATGETKIFPKATIIVRFSSPKKLANNFSSRLKSAPFEKILQKTVVNYDKSKSWRIIDNSTAVVGKNHYRFSENEWYKIFIDDDAIYRIYSSDLETAGLQLAGVDPRNIRMFNKGTEIPIFIAGEKDGQFDESDYIEFFGAAEKGRYTRNNIYWLTVGEEKGKRIQLCDSEPDSTFPIVKRSIYKKHYEKNELYYTSIANGQYEDHWFWEKLTAPTQKEIEFYLNDLVTVSALPARFTIEFRGVTHMVQNPDHHAKIFINGEQILDVKWDGQDKKQAQANINQGVFREGKNILTIELPGDTEAAADVVLLNWFRTEFWREHDARGNFFGFWGKETPGFFHYEISNLSSDEMLVYDITDSVNTRKFINFRYEDYGSSRRLTFQDSAESRHYLAISPEHTKKPALIEKDHFSQLLSPNNQADYIIITHRNFEQNIAPLASFRQNQGLNVATVRVDDIYDELNYGIKDPAAIKNFLKYAYFHWTPPAPTYVLLVGDASYDFKNYTGNSLTDFMPTHLFESATIHTETSSDNWFVCLQGEDNLPEMFIGRLPVRSNNFLDLIIQKIIHYESSPPPGRWNRKTIFVADNKDNGGPFEDVSESFIANYLPDNFDVLRVYLRDYLSEDQARAAIIDGINYGCLIVNYLGHGSPSTWASENIFNRTDVLSLNNGDKLPILVTMSCMNGYFQHAQEPYCLAEEFLNASMGGAVACLSPSGFGYTAADQYLGDGLYQSLLQDRDNILGSVVVKGKISIFASGGAVFSDHIDFYNLFGDPALKINIPSLAFAVKPDWNLISLPRAPAHASIDSALESVKNSWQKIMAFEDNHWIGADAQIPSEFWTLKELKTGRGYWLQSTSEGLISVDGAEKTSIIPLTPGWNLVGYPTVESHGLSAALQTVQGNWEKILHYADGQWYGADANLPDQFWTLNQLKPGAGYWLKMSRADTLIVSRIPVYNNAPQNPLQAAPKTNALISSAAKEINLAATNSDEYYKLTVPMPSGYFGSVYVRNLPAPRGTRISSWLDGKHFPPDAIVKNDGKYNLFLVSGDNPKTTAIEGAAQGEEIIFKIHLPSGEIFQSDTRGVWEEAVNHRLDLFALTDADSLKSPLKIQFRVDNKIVNSETVAGDPIPADATIFIDIVSEQIPLANDDIQICLNALPLTEDKFFVEKTGNQHASQFRISMPVANIESGEYVLKAIVHNVSLLPNDRYAEFSFRICSDLSLEKVVNFPNPMQDETKFTYYLLNKFPADVCIKIYTISGRLIRTIRGANGEVGYNETYWDGADEFGDPIANGVYFYKIIAKDQQQKTECVEKLVKIQ
ncbi:MAG: T9SS type A sorting domain-containing protein [Calditrichaeota bacterium]|nr:T9SS type A sorting domain-containing protein [Calditrichota bacterium]